MQRAVRFKLSLDINLRHRVGLSLGIMRSRGNKQQRGKKGKRGAEGNDNASDVGTPLRGTDERIMWAHEQHGEMLLASSNQSRYHSKPHLL